MTSRRAFVGSAVAALALVAAVTGLQAQSYPSRTIQLVAPFPAGGSADYFARALANRLGSLLGQSIVVENKPGAGGILGTKAIIGSPPDGHSLLLTSVISLVVPPSLTDPPAYDALNDVIPVTGVGAVSAVLVVRPGLNIRTFAELVAYAKANPGKLNAVSSGNGTLSHLTLMMLQQEAGISLVHVPYRGAPQAVTDLLGGHGDLMFSDAPFFIEHIRAAKLVPLAVAGKNALAEFPAIPLTARVGHPDMLAGNTYSLFAPAGTPADIVRKLNQAAVDVLKEPEIKEAFATQSALPAGDTLERFGAEVRAEAARWVPLAKASGAKLQ
jgi:tripartite-type tricarboxylate transporter receptor subunit TctC